MTSAREVSDRAVSGLTYRSEGDDDGGPGPLQPTKASRRIDELLVSLAEMKADRDKHEGLSNLRSDARDSALGRVKELEAALAEARAGGARWVAEWLLRRAYDDGVSGEVATAIQSLACGARRAFEQDGEAT